MMEIKTLRTFKTITESDSFADAAKRLNYTQSTVTFHIQQLEQELGFRLFEKIGRKMQLTEAGRAALPYVDNILNNCRQMKSLAGGGSDLKGSLRIAVTESILTYRLQPVIQAFRVRAPQVQLLVQTRDCYDMNELLIRGEADLAIHYDVQGTHPSIRTEHFCDYPLVLVGSPRLSAGERDFHTPGQHKQISFISVDTDSLYRQVLDSTLSGRGIELAGDMVLGSIAAIIQCTAANLGVAVLPAFAVEKELSDGTLIELEVHLQPAYVTAMCSYHKNKWITPAMKLFLELTREALS